MGFRDRFFWWSHNMTRLPFTVLVTIAIVPIDILKQFYLALFVTDGSETLEFPWH